MRNAQAESALEELEWILRMYKKQSQDADAFLSAWLYTHILGSVYLTYSTPRDTVSLNLHAHAQAAAAQRMTSGILQGPEAAKLPRHATSGQPTEAKRPSRQISCPVCIRDHTPDVMLRLISEACVLSTESLDRPLPCLPQDTTMRLLRHLFRYFPRLYIWRPVCKIR